MRSAARRRRAHERCRTLPLGFRRCAVADRESLMPKLTDSCRERAAQSEPPKPARSDIKHARYRVDGMDVFLDGRDLPAPCAKCRDMSQYLCDYPVIPGVTCSAPLCAACAKPVGKNKYLCLIHAK